MNVRLKNNATGLSKLYLENLIIQFSDIKKRMKKRTKDIELKKHRIIFDLLSDFYNQTKYFVLNYFVIEKKFSQRFCRTR